MANASVKALVIVALAGTSLSGCSVIGSAAGGVWSGTKSVANVATYPVRRVLRGAPDTETQFAAVETEEVVEVKTASAMGETTTTTTTQKTVEIVETVDLSATQSYDIVTVDSVSFLQLNGEGSLKDWRICEGRTDGYWIFGQSRNGGSLNPKFETCMQGMGYTLETELSQDMLALLNYHNKETSEVRMLAESTIDVEALDVDAIAADTQLAAVEVKTGSSTASDTETLLMAETIVEVETKTVMGNSSVTKSSKQSGEVVETLQLSANKSYDIVTVDDVLFIRLNGEASMTEWRACEVRTNGYWVFDETSLAGSLNPEFASCMKGLDYTLETELSDDLPAAFIAEMEEKQDVASAVEMAKAVEIAEDVDVVDAEDIVEAAKVAEADELATDVKPSP